ncbi:hypothetical protein E2C01_001499 [Portunus trituberculatus]|uniref:Uncharacterized protein n=1 Tax=Portunus trituberculatus TaxID=210409 RepID=A0A5B7CJJ7_PORTR|nr:hypothetical protein [Portunus trituberculatus]
MLYPLRPLALPQHAPPCAHHLSSCVTTRPSAPSQDTYQIPSSLPRLLFLRTLSLGAHECLTLRHHTLFLSQSFSLISFPSYWFTHSFFFLFRLRVSCLNLPLANPRLTDHDALPV